MTEIKSAIQMIVNATYSDEWQGNEELTKAQHLAIRSLNAWEEVLNELKNMREIIWQDTDDEQRIIRANAWDKIEILGKAIDIINQKLEQIEE